MILPRRSPVEAETTAHTHRTHSQWLKLVPEITAEITGKHVQVNHFQTVFFYHFIIELECTFYTNCCVEKSAPNLNISADL